MIFPLVTKFTSESFCLTLRYPPEVIGLQEGKLNTAATTCQLPHRAERVGQVVGQGGGDLVSSGISHRYSAMDLQPAIQAAYSPENPDMNAAPRLTA